MRLIYTDTGLVNDLGHHGNCCRAFRDAVSKTGLPMVVLGHRSIVPELQAELQARPHFRCFTYWNSDGDPVSGWLNAFHVALEATEQDLNSISGLRQDDILYFNSARPAQLLALAKWAVAKGDDRPRVVVELFDDPGILFNDGPGSGFRKIVDNKAVLWRYVASQLPKGGLPRFDLVTFNSQLSSVYRAVLEQDVGVLPVPQGTRVHPVNRVGRRPLTVGVLGHQREEKGYALVPALAMLLTASHPESRLLIHNSAPGQMAETQQQMRAVAAGNPRIILDERAVGADAWQELLDRTDLMVCPYDPELYAMKYSGVAVEGLANGIPLVVPANTTLSKVLRDYQDAGLTYARQTPDSIAAAVAEALNGYDDLADRAFKASAQWADAMGAGNLIQSMIDLTRR